MLSWMELYENSPEGKLFLPAEPFDLGKRLTWERFLFLVFLYGAMAKREFICLGRRPHSARENGRKMGVTMHMTDPKWTPQRKTGTQRSR